MSQPELSEHLSYLTDGPKIAAYQAAFAELIRPGDVVVDLGCGTGLLGLLALRAGAAKVYAIDSGSILGLAVDIAARNGLADRVVHLRGSSLDVELPEPADLVVADQMGGLAFDAGVLEYFADARRFLKPEGRFVPGSFTLHCAPVTNPEAGKAVDDWSAVRPSDLDFGPAGVLAANTVVSAKLDESSLLGDVSTLAERSADDTSPIEAAVTSAVTRDGTLHGVLGMFRGRMSPTVTMSNIPGAPDRMARRWQNHYPLEHPVEVTAGASVRFEIHADPVKYSSRWRIVVAAPDGSVLADERHATFLGEFLHQRDLRRNEPNRKIGPAQHLAPWNYALGRVEAGITKAALEAEIGERFAEHFGRPAAVQRFVRRVQSAVET